MAPRIARGLFRLWLVLSIAWIGAVSMVMWSTLSPSVKVLTAEEFKSNNPAGNDLPDAPWLKKKPVAGMFDDLIPQAASKPPFDPMKPYQAVKPNEFDQFDPVEFAAFKRRKELQTGIEVALIPPMLLLMVGSALGWAIRGFRN